MEAPRFAAIVRTTGERWESLTEALLSLTLQSHPCYAVVVVHADARAYDHAEALCQTIDGLRYAVLHAVGRNRKRGYPVNVGLRHCLESLKSTEYVFLLDDDDVVYPFFTQVMAAAFLTSGADVVYAAVNRRNEDRAPELAYVPKPVFHLLWKNFITSNGFAVRLDSLRSNNVWLDEEFEYAEDWRFLIELLATGFRFHPVYCPVSEFRARPEDYGDPIARELAWKHHHAMIRERVNRSCFPIPGDLLAGVAVALEEEAGGKNDLLEARMADRELLISRLQQRVLELESSRSWQVTAPLRFGGRLLLRLRAMLRPPGR